MNQVKFRVLVVLGMVVLLALLLPTVASALPAYASATGQACGVCHVNPAGGGTLTAKGQQFAAVATHATNPAGAWAQINAPAAPAPAPAAPAAAPAAPTAGNAPSAGAAPPRLPTTGDGDPSGLPLGLGLLGLSIGLLGLSLRYASVRAR